MSETARVGKQYAGQEGLDYFAWQDRLGRMGPELDAFKFSMEEVAPTDTVIDFGCGGGYMLERFDVADRIGIEPNPEARSAAEARGLRVVESAAELEAAIADFAFSHHALEHSLTPYQDLVDLRRLLKPNGRLSLWLPLDDWRRPDQRHVGREDENHHLYAWTPRTLGNLLKEAGFQVRAVMIVAHAWPPKPDVLLRTVGRSRFDMAAKVWARARRQRQLYAAAKAT